METVQEEKMRIEKRFIENPNPPMLQFQRQSGKMRAFVRRGDPHNIRQREAAGLVNEQLETMRVAVDEATVGTRAHMGYGTSHEVRGIPSTYPKFYGQLHFKGKDDFRKVMERPSERQARLINQAIGDLKKGEGYGYPVDPSNPTKYRVAAREVFDRDGIVFRRIRGRIIPIRRSQAKLIKGNEAKKRDNPEDWF